MATQVYNNMIVSGGMIDEAVIAMAVDQAFKAGQMEFVTDMFSDVRRRGVVPSNMTIAAFMGACCVRGQYDVAWEYLPPNITLSNAVYQTVMYELLQKHQWTQILAVERRMMDAGVTPNTLISIDILIAHAELGNWNSVMKWLDKLVRESRPHGRRVRMFKL